MRVGGLSRFSVENFLSHRAENFRRWESFSVSLISGTEIVWIRGGGGGVSRFSVEKFLSHSAENFQRGALSCFTNFGYRKNLRIREGGGGIKILRRKFFVSQCRKNPYGESFSVSLISGIEKVWIRGGEYQDFPSKFFCLTVPKTFIGEPFRVSLISGTEKNYASERGEGVSRFSVENFLSHSAEKIRMGNPLVFH